MEVEDDPMAELARCMDGLEVSKMSDEEAESLRRTIQYSVNSLIIESTKWADATRAAKVWSIERARECLGAFCATRDAEYLGNALAYLFEEIPCPEAVRKHWDTPPPPAMED